MPSTVRSSSTPIRRSPALGVEERGDGLERRVGDVPVVLAVLLQIPAQARLELEGLRLLELEQLLGAPVPLDVVVEQEVLERPPELGVVGDALVEVEVGLYDLLDPVLDLGVKGQPHVLARVSRGRWRQGPASSSRAERRCSRVRRCSRPRFRPKRSFSASMMRDSGSSSSAAGSAARLAPGGIERPGLPFQRDPAAIRPLDAERLHVDALLHLDRQLLAASPAAGAGGAGEDVEFSRSGSANVRTCERNAYRRT